MKKNNILIFAPSLNVTSGVTNHIIPYLKNINHEKFNIDFLVMDNNDKTYNNLIEGYNGKIYVINKPKIHQILKYIFGVNNFFKENAKKYDIIHCHNYNFGSIILHYAKKYKIKTRILHMHVTKYSDNCFKAIINSVFAYFAKKNSNEYFACTNEVGKFAFKNRKFSVINNAFEIEKFKFDSKSRNELRKKLGISSDTVIIGNIGRLKEQKNPLFLIDIFYEYNKLNKNSNLLIIGNGPLKTKIIELSKKKNIYDNIIFIDSVTDTYNYYQIMDYFVLPSIYEGLGIVLIEAQSNGLKCFCTDYLPEQVFITNSCKGISLNKSAKIWAKEIEKTSIKREDNIDKIISAGFSVNIEAKKLEKKYYKLIEKTWGEEK